MNSDCFKNLSMGEKIVNKDKSERFRFFPIILICVLLITYFIYLFFAFAQVPMDSDFASLVLEANDILSGNIFLNGWYLTGATFILSEIPFYLIGSAIFDISVKSYILAASLMTWFMIISACLLSLSSKKKLWLQILIFFAIAGFPGLYLLKSSRAHGGIFIINFALLICIQYLFRNTSVSKSSVWIVYFLLITFGIASDLFILPILVVPVIFYCAAILLSNRDNLRKFHSKLLGITVVAVIAGKIIEKLYLSHGAILNNRINNSYNVSHFANFEDLPKNFMVYLQILLKLFDCDITDTLIFSPQSVLIFLRFIIIFFGFWTVFKSIRDFFSQKKYDLVNLLISLGIVSLSIWLIISRFLEDINCGRYYAYFPAAFAVLIIRYLNEKDVFSKRIAMYRIPATIPIAVISTVLIAGSIQPVKTTRVPTPQDRLATFLKDNNLTEGYSDFWNANHVVVAAKNKVQIRAIFISKKDNGSKAYPYYWFSKSEWYKNPNANFVVIKTQGDYAGYHNVKTENVLQYFGEPLQKLEFEDYMIFVYPKGISEKIVP